MNSSHHTQLGIQFINWLSKTTGTKCDDVTSKQGPCSLKDDIVQFRIESFQLVKQCRSHLGKKSEKWLSTKINQNQLLVAQDEKSISLVFST